MIVSLFSLTNLIIEQFYCVNHIKYFSLKKTKSFFNYNTTKNLTVPRIVYNLQVRWTSKPQQIDQIQPKNHIKEYFTAKLGCKSHPPHQKYSPLQILKSGNLGEN